MSSQIFTPVNQVRLTNVSVVRVRRQGLRFELACYRNKLADYRRGLTTDLDDVLQTRQFFVNVSKGQLANQADVLRCFPDLTPEQIIRSILDTGEVQVNEREREEHLQSLGREIATLVSERCLNPTTKTPYPVAVIERAMTEILHYSVRPERSAKQQCLDVIKQLQQRKALNIVRARLRLQVTPPTSLSAFAESLGVEVEDAEKGIFLVEPGQFRPLQALTASLRVTLTTLSIKE
jgi:ribosome maturation protein SDO1